MGKRSWRLGDDKINRMAQNWGHWASTPTEPVAVPGLHLLALVVYATLMVAYVVYVCVMWTNFVQPVLFESRPTSDYKAIPLSLAIDCQDCREDRIRAPDSSLWMLRWDYSSIPGGCASQNAGGGDFSDELRQFCAAQNASPPPGPPEYLHMKDVLCQIALIIPGLLLPSVPGVGPSANPGPQSWPFPFSVELGALECQAKCNANPACTAFLWSPPVNRPAQYIRPLSMNNTCYLLTDSARCAVEVPSPGTDLYVRLPPPPPQPPLVDPLDRCTITSKDAELFLRSPSPEQWVLTTPAQMIGMGDNPNYIGPGGRAHYTRTGRDGPEGLGSFYELKHAVPICFAGDDNLDGSGMFLEIMNIPDHAFADPLKTGQAVVTISSGRSFKQRNAFQPCLTVERDEAEKIVAAEPFFANFQYDGRTDFGREHSLAAGQGDEYDGITKEDAVVVDTANFFGLISEEPAGPVTSWENITEAQIQAWASFFGPGAIAAQAREAAWRMETTRRTSPGNPNPTVVGVGRRRLESSGPPVGQEFLAQLGRDHVTAAGPLSPPPTPTHRRRLDNHDEWGGVSLSLKLAKYASIYTLGHKYNFYDLFSDVGGASGSLIGLIGLALGVLEAAKALLCSSATDVKGEDVEAGENSEVSQLRSSGGEL